MVKVQTDLRGTFVPIRDQGRRPTCTAFAVSDTHASARAELVALSPEHLHYHGAVRSGSADPDQGIYLETALEALEHDGQCGEAGWPYITVLPIDPMSPTGMLEPPRDRHIGASAGSA